MPKNNKIKILCLLIIGIVFLYIYGPIAFMKDGLVTRQSVNSFDELYELGPARRHKCENGTRIYIVYFGSVSYTHLTLPTTCNLCRSRWSPYH